MCGIFGVVDPGGVEKKSLVALAKHAKQRGSDSSGLIWEEAGAYAIARADYPITTLIRSFGSSKSTVAAGHSRLVTNGQFDNQPVLRAGICVLHNGIIVNHDEIWREIGLEPMQQIDSEIIAGLAEAHFADGGSVDDVPSIILDKCRGVVACALLVPSRGKLILFSNNGSLYVGKHGTATCFASEEYSLAQLGCEGISQVCDAVFIDVAQSNTINEDNRESQTSRGLIADLPLSSQEEKYLEHPTHELRRCTRCILPETMPYIEFDDDGVCNYCRYYRIRNKPKPTSELFDLVEPYRKNGQRDCIVPFSGGRDSCYSLHLIAKELELNPIAYTYDWGMVTDLGRRNISRMCADLGVENIIIAADIVKKRANIRRNINAWLQSPHLGMVNLFTAGDKHFFRHVETVKQQTGVQLNLWGVNPLEVTHFKSGFLGVPPDFAETKVYSHGAMKQLRYHKLRFGAMLKSPGYFNRSLWDTLSGEYYRSFHEKSDYFHVFDYWRWDEQVVDDTLEQYEWEKAPDTSTTWRIGDGTAAFYNYIFYVVAGFTEHDTFRSNQIREGDLDREHALALVADENRPRYPNIKWYLDAVGLDFVSVIKTINDIPRLVGG